MSIKYINKKDINVFNNTLAQEYCEYLYKKAINDSISNINSTEALKAYTMWKYALNTQDAATKVIYDMDTVTYLNRPRKNVDKANDPGLQRTIANLKNNKFFDTILDSNRAVNPVSMNYTDFGGVNMATSLKDMENIYSKLNNMIKNGTGFVHSIDTETIGATNIDNVWKPKFVTEFAKVSTDLSTNTTTKTNIFITSPDVYKEEYDRLVKVLSSGSKGIEQIKKDNSLRVSAERFALYGSNKTKLRYNMQKGYSQIIDIASIEDIDNIYDLDLIKSGYDKMSKARVNTKNLTINGKDIKIKADVKEYIDSLADIQKSLNSNNGIVNGYNITKFDLKTINASIQNIIRDDADALTYAIDVFGTSDISKIGLRATSNSVLDLQNFTRAYTNVYGPKSLIGDKIFKDIYGKNVNRQEYLGQKFYPALMQAASHAAIADTQVVHAMILENAEGMNKSLFQHVYEGLSKSNLRNETIGNKSILFANKGTPFNSDRNVLSFVTDLDNNVYFSSGHAVLNGNVTHSDINIAPSVGVKKNGMYSIEDIFSLDSKDFYKDLSLDLPEYSSGQLHVVKLKSYHSNKYNGANSEGYIYQVFNSYDEAIGYINSGFSHVGDFDDKGNFKMSKFFNQEKIQTGYRNKDHFDIDKKGWNKLSDIKKLNKYANYYDYKTSENKAANFLFGDKSAKKISGVLDFLDEVKSKGYSDVIKDPTEFAKFYNNKGQYNLTVNGKTFSKKEFSEIENIMKKTLGFKKGGKGSEYTLLGTTAYNAIYAIDHVDKLQDYYKKVLKSIATEKYDGNIKSKTYKDIYNELVKNKVQVDSIFEEVNDYLVASKALELNKGDYEKAMKIASHAGKYSDTIYNLNNMYDFKLSDKFYLQDNISKTKKFNVFNQMDDYFTVSTKAVSPTSTFINDLTKKYLGNTKVLNDSNMYKYQRSAFYNFIKEIDNNRMDYRDLFFNKDFVNMVQDVLENEDFDLEDSAQKVIDSIVLAKKDGNNIRAGIKRNIYERTTRVGNNIAKGLNKISEDAVTDALSMVNISTITKKNKSNIVREISSKYLFDINELDNVDFVTKADKDRAYRLYHQFDKAINTTVDDLLEASKISGTKVSFNKRTGNLILTNNGKSINVTEIPKLVLDGSTLKIRTFTGTDIEYHEVLGLNDKGFVELRTNLGGDFGKEKAITKRVRRDLENNTFDLFSMNQKMVRNASLYKESPYIKNTMKDYITGNGKIDVSDMDKMFSLMFGQDSTEKGKAIWTKLKANNKLNAENIENYLDAISELGKGELSSSIRAMSVTDIVTILNEFVDNASPDAPTIRNIINTISTTGKETDVTRGIYQTNSNNVANLLNMFDAQGRPTIISQMNANYLRSNTVDGTKYIYENLLIGSSIIEDRNTMMNIYKNLNIGLDRVGIQTDFTHSAAYLGVIGLENTFTDEMDRVIKEFKFDSRLNVKDPDDLIKNMYAKMHNQYVGATFEQSRIMDSRLIKSVYGHIPQDTQTLSTLKDINNALELMLKDSETGKSSNKLIQALDLLGSVSIDENGNVAYKKSIGTIVHRREGIFKTSSFGDGVGAFGSKFDTGILNFKIKTDQGIELTEEEISKLLTSRLHDMSDREAKKIIEASKSKEGLFSMLLSDVLDGYNTTFEVENVNSAELLKMGNAEKGMGYIPLTKIGSIDSTLKSFMKDIGQEKYIENNAISSKALAAFISDYVRDNKDKAQDLYNKYGVSSMEGLISKITGLRDIEEDELSRMFFSKEGVFKGKVSAVFNDNVMGHKNMGSANAGTLSKATELYGKYFGTKDMTMREQYELGMNKIIDLVNNNKEFQFLKKDMYSKDASGTKYSQEAYKLTRQGTTYMIDGDNMKSTLDEYGLIDFEAFNSLIEKIDEDLQQKGASLEDRLVFKDVYTYNKKGELVKQDKVIGNLRLSQIEKDGKTYNVVNGINSNTNTKLWNDSEVQSFVSDDYLFAKQQLYKKKSMLEEAKKNGELDRIKSLEGDIEKLEDFTFNQEGYSRRMKIDDQFRGILSANRLNDITEKDLNNRFKQGTISDRFLEAAKDFIIKDNDGNLRIKDGSRSDNVYESFISDIRGLMTYDPTKEQKMTKQMINTSKYSKYKDVYNFVTGELGMELGVDSAQKIYGIQGAYRAYHFNANPSNNIEKELIEKYGFKSMNIRDFSRSFGKKSLQLDSMAEQGYIIDLGRDFNNTKLAIPALGSSSGDYEIGEKWHKRFNALKASWDEYDSYLGDKNIDNNKLTYLKSNIIDQVNEITNETNKLISKDGELGRLAKIEANVPYTRTKLISLNDSSSVRSLVGSENMVKMSDSYAKLINDNSFKSKAIINGKTIQEWEKGGLESGIFFNYGTASIGEFERMGLLSDNYIKAMGMSSREEMMDYLERHGTMQLIDRYPNIMQKSVQNVRIFLDRNAEDGTTSVAEHVLLNFNGDSDGDSTSKLLLTSNDVNYNTYDISRNKAESYFAKRGGEYTEEDIRKRTIDNLTSIDFGYRRGEDNKHLSRKEATEIYDTFKSYENSATMDTISNLDMVAEKVLPTMFKDEAKNYRLSGGEVVGANIKGMKNISAQVEGGKSVLGKIRVSNLQNAPGALDELGGSAYLVENTKKINDMMRDISKNKDEIIKSTGINLDDYEFFKKFSSSPEQGLNIYKYGEEQHRVLDEILSIVEKDNQNKKILNTSYDDARETIINRIRSDIYNQDSISKSNKGVIGEVNAPLYSIKQAAGDILGKSENEYDSFKNSIIQDVGKEMEQHVISSKKKLFEPGDTRLKDLSEYIFHAKNPGDNGLQETIDDVSNWIFTYMDNSTIDTIYTQNFIKLSGSPIKTKDTLGDKTKQYLNHPSLSLSADDAKAKAQSDFISQEFVNAIFDLNNTEEGKAAIDMYSIFGRESGTLKKTAERIDISSTPRDSFASTALSVMTGVIPEEKPKIPPGPNTNFPRPDSKLTQTITKEIADVGKDLLNGVSGSGIAMGILGLASGLLIGGYASGNPLKDPKNDHIENKPQQIENMSVPDFFNENSGYVTSNPQQKGYIINIKADTKKGQRYAKKAMKEAAAASTGGAVNINMNFKSNNSGGYSDKDIEDIIKNYI